MEKRKIVTIAYWIMIIAVVLTCIYVYFYLNSNAKLCMANPMEYYEKIKQAKCYCYQGDFLNIIGA